MGAIFSDIQRHGDGERADLVIFERRSYGIIREIALAAGDDTKGCYGESLKWAWRRP